MEDEITLKELEELAAKINVPKMTIPKWKVIVKEFADKHGLTDARAIELANLARESFK